MIRMSLDQVITNITPCQLNCRDALQGCRVFHAMHQVMSQGVLHQPHGLGKKTWKHHTPTLKVSGRGNEFEDFSGFCNIQRTVHQ